ncbi:SIMPL domain-containing protein [Flavobacterium sp.]
MKKTILLFIALISISGFCQSNTVADKPFIEVTGTAEKQVAPDKIFVRIKLIDKTNDNKYSIAEQETQLKAMLARIGIDLNNLSLSDMDSEIIRNKRKETGQKLSKEFTLLVKNAAEVSKVFQELHVLSIKEATIIRVENSRIEEHRKEVRIAALQAAKSKAEYLLNAIGQQIDKPLEIREDKEIYASRLASNFAIFSEEYGESEFEKFTIKFSYTVKYGIK